MKNKVSSLLLILLLNFSIPIFSNDQAFIQLTSYISQNPTSGKGSYVKFENTDLVSNIEISKDRKVIKFTHEGIYLINLSAQCGSNEFGATGFVDCWFEKNGKPLGGSTTRVSIDSQESTQVLTSLNINQFEANSELGVVFSASGPGVGISSYMQQSRPSVSSAQLVIIRIQ
jgi:hypothetical protein